MCTDTLKYVLFLLVSNLPTTSLHAVIAISIYYQRNVSDLCIADAAIGVVITWLQLNLVDKAKPMTLVFMLNSLFGIGCALFQLIVTVSAIVMLLATASNIIAMMLLGASSVPECKKMMPEIDRPVRVSIAPSPTAIITIEGEGRELRSLQP